MLIISQLTFTSSKSTIKEPEKRCEISSKLTMNTKTTSLTSFWCLYCQLPVSLLSTYFIPFSSVFIVDFEQVNVCWVSYQIIYLHRSEETTFTRRTWDIEIWRLGRHTNVFYKFNLGCVSTGIYELLVRLRPYA